MKIRDLCHGKAVTIAASAPVSDAPLAHEPRRITHRRGGGDRDRFAMTQIANFHGNLLRHRS